MVYRYVSILEKEKQMLEELGEHGIVILVYLYVHGKAYISDCLLYTSPSPRDLSTSRMPSSA